MARAFAAAPSLVSLQRELQYERERHCRSLESIEQLRLEMQMMARAFAAAREQIVELGGNALSVEAERSAGASGASKGRARSDVKTLQRLQTELADSRGRERRLQEQVAALKAKVGLLATVRKELLNSAHELTEHLSAG